MSSRIRFDFEMDFEGDVADACMNAIEGRILHAWDLDDAGAYLHTPDSEVKLVITRQRLSRPARSVVAAVTISKREVPGD